MIEQGKPVTAESAGFVGPGRQPPQAARTVGLYRGLDMTAHRSRLVSQSMLDSADIVVVMTAEQATRIRDRVRRGPIVVLGDLDPAPIRKRTIHDPWKGDETVFDTTYERIDRCLDVLAKLISTSGLSTSS